MAIKSLILWFYCLPMREVQLLLLACTIVFFIMHMMFSYQKWWKWAIGIALTALMLAVVVTTLGGRGETGNYQVNLIPFHSYRAVQEGANPELYRSNFMNVALFYPAGLLAVTLLPKKWPAWGRCLPVVLLLCAMSAGIEFLQYRFSLGQVEIDDVIHNTMGALTGSAVGLLVPHLFHVIKEKLEGHLSAAVKQ